MSGPDLIQRLELLAAEGYAFAGEAGAELSRIRALNAELLEALQGMYSAFKDQADLSYEVLAVEMARDAMRKAAGEAA